MVIKLFGQYADDMDIYCKNQKETLQNIQSTLNNFCAQSGLKINYDKTTLYRIGKVDKNVSIAQNYTTQMREEKEKINVLGIWITNDTESMLKLNYKDLIEKSKAILSMWNNRDVSLIGKIQVINALVASLHVYKMYVLPKIPHAMCNQLNKMMNNFIWNNRRPKIPLAKLQNTQKCGGLNLVDFQKKDQAIKCTWVQTIQSDMYMAEHAFANLSPILRSQIWLCNLKAQDVVKIFGTGFWPDVLESWCILNYKELNLAKAPQDNDIMNEYLWYNSNILFKGKPFLFKKAFQEGLTLVGQMYMPDRTIIMPECAKDLFELDPMQYNTIVTALPKEWKRYMKVKTGCALNNQPPQFFYDTYVSLPNPSRYHYQKTMQQKELNFNTYVRWQMRLHTSLSYEEFLKLYVLAWKISNNSKLRSFQYRLLSLAVVTNVQLHKWNIKNYDTCEHCKMGSETLEHLFYECVEAKRLLKQSEAYVNEKYKQNRNYAFTVENVLFNKIENDAMHLINFVILSMKMYIYSRKCTMTKISVTDFNGYIEEIRKTEYCNPKGNGKLRYYYRKWFKSEMQTAEDHVQDLNVQYTNDIQITDNLL